MGTELTDTVVKLLPAPEKGKGARIVYDDKVKGLGVRTTSAGAKSFVLNFTVAGRERRLTIGSFPSWKVKEARERAKELRRDIDIGVDPLAEREARRTAPTVSELADRFVTEHLSRRRASSGRSAGILLNLYVRPQLGATKVADMRHADVERLHRGIASGKLTPSGRGAPYQANRTAALLSKMFSLAVKWELRADNPVKGIEREPEQKRERFLSPAELARLGEALAAHPERASANAIRLLLLTGARRGEVLGATWSEIDLTVGAWVKPSAHTKQKREHRVPLSAPALALLVEMKAAHDAENERRARYGAAPLIHLFPGVEGRSLTEIKHSWAAICRKAGLGTLTEKRDAAGKGVWKSDARIHDLRHTYASVLASAGLSLPIIGALLGHTQPGTTARYAHLMDDVLRIATDRAGAVIGGAASAEVLPFRRGAA